MTIKTRFAPSPTGVLHLGSVRTALFCWLYARHCGGKFALRIEDTDRERSTDENVDAILDAMDWLGLDYDEGPIFQTQRFDRYAEVIKKWLDDGLAYHCYCTKEELDAMREAQRANGETPRYDGRCRDRTEPREGVDPVVRFRNPQSGEVVVNDHVRGRVVFDNRQLDDLIIARSDKTPTYNFTVVIDDVDMEISHVIRGDDHLNNTPRQINMMSALGATPPEFAHLPMILGPDGAKLSKRHAAVDIRDYRNEGFLPEALLNYLVRLGWSHGDREIFEIEDMVREFDIADVNKSASTFNPEKLRWVSQQHIMNRSPSDLGVLLSSHIEALGLSPRNGPDPADVAEAFQERAVTLREMAESSRFCFENSIELDPVAAKKQLRPVVFKPLSAIRTRLADVAEWQHDAIKICIDDVAAEFEMNLGKLGQPLRVAVTGGAVSPSLDVTLFLVGKDRTLARLDQALLYIEGRIAASAG